MPYVNSKESSSSPLIRPLFTPSSSSSSLLPQLISSSSSVAPPVYPPGTMQHPYGTPLFQPFPSLAQTSSLGSVITKEQIHNAFLKLVQVSLSISHFHSFHIYEIVFHQTDLALFHLLFCITFVFLFCFSFNLFFPLSEWSVHWDGVPGTTERTWYIAGCLSVGSYFSSSCIGFSKVENYSNVFKCS